MRSIDAHVIVANLTLLLVASLFPWPASVISAAVSDGTRSDQVAACLLYAAVGLAVPLAWILLYGQLARATHLLSDATQPAYMRLGVRRSLFSVVVFPVAGFLALLEPVVALVAFAVVPLIYIATLLQLS